VASEKDDSIDPNKIIEQNDQPSQEDAERNARAFADAMRSMEAILSPAFGHHVGGVMSKSEFGPLGTVNDSAVQEDTSSADAINDAVAKAMDSIGQPIDAWGGQDEKAFATTGGEFAPPASPMRPPQTFQTQGSPGESQSQRTASDAAAFTGGEQASASPIREFAAMAGTPPATPPGVVEFEQQAVQRDPVQQELNKGDAKFKQGPQEASATEEPQRRYGGPEFLRRMSSPERPIMDAPESGTKEQTANQWMNHRERAFQSEADPGAEPVQGKFGHENDRSSGVELQKLGDAVDEYGLNNIATLESMTASLLMLSRRLERIQRSLESEGRDYE
jgi:hypothetical protein